MAQVGLAERIQGDTLLMKRDPAEAILLLQQAMNHGSPHAALRLAQIYRRGDLGQPKNSYRAIALAYRTIELAVQADPTTSDGNPLYEMAAGHLLVEMAKAGEALDTAGRSVLSQDEVHRLEHFYGTPDPVSQRVKIIELNAKLQCVYGIWTEPIWVWDWARAEFANRTAVPAFGAQDWLR